jgi:hypothetical protein
MRVLPPGVGNVPRKALKWASRRHLRLMPYETMRLSVAIHGQQSYIVESDPLYGYDNPEIPCYSPKVPRRR